jgi:hypothetical protein
LLEAAIHLKRAKKSGEYYAARDVLDAMQARVDARISGRQSSGLLKGGNGDERPAWACLNPPPAPDTAP